MGFNRSEISQIIDNLGYHPDNYGLNIQIEDRHKKKKKKKKPRKRKRRTQY